MESSLDIYYDFVITLIKFKVVSDSVLGWGYTNSADYDAQLKAFIFKHGNYADT